MEEDIPPVDSSSQRTAVPLIPVLKSQDLKKNVLEATRSFMNTLSNLRFMSVMLLIL